jgi:hypothetical protein
MARYYMRRGYMRNGYMRVATSFEMMLHVRAHQKSDEPVF